MTEFEDTVDLAKKIQNGFKGDNGIIEGYDFMDPYGKLPDPDLGSLADEIRRDSDRADREGPALVPYSAVRPDERGDLDDDSFFGRAYQLYQMTGPEFREKKAKLADDFGIDPKVLDAVGTYDNAKNVQAKQEKIWQKYGVTKEERADGTISLQGTLAAQEIRERFPDLNRLRDVSAADVVEIMRNLHDVKQVQTLTDAAKVGVQNRVTDREKGYIGWDAFYLGDGLTAEQAQAVKNLEKEREARLELPDYGEDPALALVGSVADLTETMFHDYAIGAAKAAGATAAYRAAASIAGWLGGP